MNAIDDIEEFDRDWDWFAVGHDGTIAHFTTAGIRPLPISVKSDRESALRLIEYFFEEAPKTREYVIEREGERNSGWRSGEPPSQNRYLRDFVKMAAAGLFSYDTETSAPDTRYFLVARPKNPLQIDELPPEISKLLVKSHSLQTFRHLNEILAAETLGW